MSLLDELGYRYPKMRWYQRVVPVFASTRFGAWFFRRTAHHADRLVHRLSAGRATLTSWLAGKPVIMVTTKGARSGKHRTVPLLGIPVGDTLALIGSNFGQKPTPGWVHNLLAHPEARVAYRDRFAQVQARLADSELASRVFEEAAPVYAGYLKYRERVQHREIKVFVLEPVSSSA